jgi:hypothetical protein
MVEHFGERIGNLKTYRQEGVDFNEAETFEQ